MGNDRQNKIGLSSPKLRGRYLRNPPFSSQLENTPLRHVKKLINFSPK